FAKEFIKCFANSYLGAVIRQIGTADVARCNTSASILYNLITTASNESNNHSNNENSGNKQRLLPALAELVEFNICIQRCIWIEEFIKVIADLDGFKNAVDLLVFTATFAALNK